ncbi:MAG: hypothetical protein II685_01715 [Clostridia bacterium]|nr:hypothetical protein [Clostridia bacterium]
MSSKIKILCVISSLCFLGSIACFSGYAAELFDKPSGEDYALTQPAAESAYTDPGYTEQPAYTEPTVSYYEPESPVSAYTEPVQEPVVSYEPEYTDPGTTASYEQTYSDSGYGYESTPAYSGVVSDVVGDQSYAQPTYDYSSTTYNTYSAYNPYNTYSTYIDYTSQYNQYVANTYQAQYDDNYYYVPSYTAPQESLIDIESKEVDTDELTQDDWARIMLDLSDGNVSDNGANTFNFIKENEEKGDTSVSWMLYLGASLIAVAVFIVIFVVITTNKANDKLKYA